MRAYGWNKRPRLTDRKNAQSYKQLKNFNSRRVANTRIDHLRCLIGRKVEIDVPTDTGTNKRIVTISNLYPHMALCTYLVGKEGPKTELRIGLSVSDLVTLGLIDFRIGKAEVIA